VLEGLELLLQLSERILQQVAGLVVIGLLALPTLGEGRLALFTELAAREEMRELVPHGAVVVVSGPAELVVQQLPLTALLAVAEGLVIRAGQLPALIMPVAAGL
jgi:hypothetical protein